ncbi:hypothetical protein [uncultured Massilia sp.]|uniref:hypothetical protein n=1 Tax=uncultured Massilia sp. TaxID=169973 RepID=UPI0025CE2430|nr:hypothetical protein [uncultured Massilia sp.]
MQQRPPGTPSPGFNFAIAAVLGLTGTADLAYGIMHMAFGHLLTGLGATAYAVLLVREGLHIRRTGQRALAPRRMAQAGFACLAVFLLGILLKGWG